ncbi:MAG TPA: DUF1501 domain-containing protein [Fimbriimonas sp.]|nr:DUF1501 domain-containing protein [Fimbriimonas sp.]
MEIEALGARDWWSCDGNGHTAAEEPRVAPVVTRRGLITGAALAGVTWLANSPSLAQLTVASDKASKNILVSIFLRGGADGMNLVVPHGDDAYYRNRPLLGVAKKDVLDLDGFFGFNPSLASMLPLYKEGKLGIVHACGSMDQTRSHFEAMNAMERGLDGLNEGPVSGWLARHLIANPRQNTTPLRAVAFGRTMPDALRGATNAIALESLQDFKLDGSDAVQRALADLYGSGKDPLTNAGRETLTVLDQLKRLDPAAYKPEHGAAYPESDLAKALKQVAFLVKADIGLEIACLDKGGWDTHYGQNLGGQLSGLLEDLSKSLAAFTSDLGPELSRVTVIVQTEFGRRLRENQSLGTDHGRGSVLFALGGGVKGGKVYGRWPGLEAHQLDPEGDLRVTTDYRTVLHEALSSRLGSNEPVFLDMGEQPLGMLG